MLLLNEVGMRNARPDPDGALVDDDGIWLGEERKEIVLQVSEQLMLPHQQGVYAERAVS